MHTLLFSRLPSWSHPFPFLSPFWCLPLLSLSFLLSLLSLFFIFAISTWIWTHFGLGFEVHSNKHPMQWAWPKNTRTEILRNADLDSITPKQIRDTLQLETKVDLLGYKKALKPIIEECYDEVAKEKALADAISDDSESDPEGETRKPAASPVVDQSPAKKSKKEEQPKKRTRQPKNDKPKKKRVIDPEKRESNNFTRTWILDDMLAEVTGQKAVSKEANSNSEMG